MDILLPFALTTLCGLPLGFFILYLCHLGSVHVSERDRKEEKRIQRAIWGDDLP